MSIQRTAGSQNAANPKQPLGGSGGSNRAPAFQISPALETQSYLKCLVYGEAGSGKTWLCGTSLQIDSMHDVLLINADQGELTLTTEPELKDHLGSLATVQCTSWREFARVYDFLKLHCKLRQADDENGLKELQDKYMGEGSAKKRLYKFKTVIIDSISEVEAFSMSTAMGVEVDGALDEEMPTSSWDEIRQNRSNILRLARQFRDLPMHILLTAGRSLREDQTTKKSAIMPDLTGSLREKLPHYMDLVGYLTVNMTTKNEERVIVRRMYVQPIGRWIAKCRFASYREQWFDNPTMPEVLKGVGLD